MYNYSITGAITMYQMFPKFIYWRIKFKVRTLKPQYLLKIKKNKNFETTIIVKLFTPK